MFTREELSRNSGKPCYILEFYTAKKQYSYKVDAKNGSIMEAYHFILLADAKKIALDDAGVNVKSGLHDRRAGCRRHQNALLSVCLCRYENTVDIPH